MIRKLFLAIAVVMSATAAFGDDPPAAGAVPKVDSKDLFKEVKNAERLEQIGEALKSKADEQLAMDIAHFCSKKRVKALGKSKDSVKRQAECYTHLALLYTQLAEQFKDNKAFIENREALQAKLASDLPALAKSDGLEIKIAEPLKQEERTSRSGSQVIDLSRYFTISSTHFEDYRGHFVYSVDGCAEDLSADIEAKDDSVEANAKDIKLLDRRFNALESFKGLAKCRLEESTGKLTLIPVAGATGDITLAITVKYMDQSGKNELDRRTDSLAVRLVSQQNPNFCIGWECRYIGSFFLGVEGANIEEVNNETILRYEFYSYSQIQTNHFHLFGRVFQTSKSENVQRSGVTNFDCSDPSVANWSTNCKTEVDEAISGVIGANFFIGKSSTKANREVDWWAFDESLENGDLAFGPTFQYSVIKSDEGDKDFEEGYFGGIRFAYSKYQFFDIMYGKDEGVRGNRAKLTGQLPVANNNFVAGVEVNVATDSDHKKKYGEGVDSIKFYVTYDVDFKSFLQ